MHEKWAYSICVTLMYWNLNNKTQKQWQCASSHATGRRRAARGGRGAYLPTHVRSDGCRDAFFLSKATQGSHKINLHT